MSVRLLFAMVAVLLLASVEAARADTIYLQDGTTRQGKILSETDAFVILEVPSKSGKSVISTTIPKTTVVRIKRSPPDERAFQTLTKYQLNPAASLPLEQYDVALTAFRKFIAENPGSVYAIEVRGWIDDWEFEKKQVASGMMKIFDPKLPAPVWLTHEQAAPFIARAQLGAQIQQKAALWQTHKAQLEKVKYQRADFEKKSEVLQPGEREKGLRNYDAEIKRLEALVAEDERQYKQAAELFQKLPDPIAEYLKLKAAEAAALEKAKKVKKPVPAPAPAAAPAAKPPQAQAPAPAATTKTEASVPAKVASVSPQEEKVKKSSSDPADRLESVGILGLVVFGIGVLIGLAGGIWFIVIAWQEGAMWGIGCLLCWPVQLYFLVSHWSDTKKPFFVQLIGVAVMYSPLLLPPMVALGGLVLAGGGGGYLFYRSRRQPTAPAEGTSAETSPPVVPTAVPRAPMMRPQKATLSVGSAWAAKLIRLVVVVAVVVGGYFGYQAFKPKTQSGAFKAYQEFSEHLVRRRYSDAQKMSTDEAAKQVTEFDKTRWSKEKIVFEGSSPPIVIGIICLPISEEKEGGDKVKLKVHQRIRYDPTGAAFGVGMVGPISKPGGATGGGMEELIHEATLVHSGDDWKVASFSIAPKE